MQKQKLIPEELLVPEKGGRYYDRSTDQKVVVKFGDQKLVVVIYLGKTNRGLKLPIPTHNFWRDFSPICSKGRVNRRKDYRASRKFIKRSFSGCGAR